MSATIIPMRGGVGVPPIPPGARPVTDRRQPVADEIALRRVGEIAREQAEGVQCGNTRLALAALSDACYHWAEGHTMAMADALDMFAMMWRSRETNNEL